MRITTKVIMNNSLSNINTNKRLQDKLNNQMATEKKVNRPSDDPVVAIRALRLRTNVSQVTQFYERNAPDAESWMSVTEDALSTVTEVITDMIEQCEKGANENLTSTDRETLLDALRELRDEVYSTGNADYAGRSVFTGYRTETTLKFTKDETKKYSITEQIDNSVIDEITHTDSDFLLGINDSNYNNATNTAINETQVVQNSIHRIRLAYSDVDGAGDYAAGELPTLTVYNPATGSFEGVTGTDADGNETTVTTRVVSLSDNPYMTITDDEILVVEETGEMLLGENVYRTLMALEDDPTTPELENEIRVTYQKSEWLQNDLKPEHYFACTDKTDPAKIVQYNQNYLSWNISKQAIEYDVGLNQTIQVNITADQVFQHDIGRDVDDLIKVMEEVTEMEDVIDGLKDMINSGKYSETELVTINNQLDAAEKALTLKKEVAQKAFESGITKMQGHLDTVNYATTLCGTRGKKLELITNRLMSQKTNFETLQSDNENVEITDVAIQLSSAELTYEAALMATSKIISNSLMNYI